MPAGAATCTGHTCSHLRRIAEQDGSAGEKLENCGTLAGNWVGWGAPRPKEDDDDEDEDEDDKEAAAPVGGNPSCLRRRCSFQCALE